LYAFVGRSGSPSVDIEDANGNMIAQFNIETVDSHLTPTFLGFVHELGISRIRVGTFIGGPIFDNVTFGGVVPEPTGWTLFLLGLCMFGIKRN
jgi:hypothetical protein